jgi:hypothetical protein
LSRARLSSLRGVVVVGGCLGWEVMDLTCWRGVVRAVDLLLRGARSGLMNALVGGSLWLIGGSGESF